MPKQKTFIVFQGVLPIMVGVFLFLVTGCLKSKDPGLPVGVQKALNLAHLNRPELMKAILTYAAPKDSIQLESVYFLISNLPQQYSIYVSLADSQGHSVHLNPLSFTSENAIKQHLDSISHANGTVNYRADSFHVDLNQVNAQYLTLNVESAFEIWQDSKWSQEYPFDVFKKWILPYRAANEPIVHFRKHFIQIFKDKIPPTASSFNAIKVIDTRINNELTYDPRFDREANPQNIDELERSRTGSSLDIAIYKVYALRSMGIPSSIDYCPLYSDTTGGIFVASALLPDGCWKNLPPKEIPLPFPEKITPKVFRRSFNKIESSMYSKKDQTDHTPAFIGHYDYTDVTDEYLKVGDLLFTDIINDHKFVYLAVFNDKEWKAIDWCQTDSTKNISFRNVGKGHRYRLMTVTEKEIKYLSDPFHFE